MTESESEASPCSSNLVELLRARASAKQVDSMTAGNETGERRRMLDYVARGNAAPLPPPRGFLANTMLGLFGAFSRAVWALEISGLHHVPATGPFILCPNHESHLDIFWVASCLPPDLRRSLCCFGKREHFEALPSRMIATFARAIPIDREGDVLPAMRAGAKALQLGRPLLVHPEGTRTRTGLLGPFRGGVVPLALATGAPLIPVLIMGAYDIYPARRRLPRMLDWRRLRRRKLRVVFGAPIASPAEERGPGAEAKLIEHLRRAVKELGS